MNRLFADRAVGQQSLVKFVSNDRFLRLTHEQFRIISNDIKAGEVIKINAFAGTGAFKVCSDAGQIALPYYSYAAMRNFLWYAFRFVGKTTTLIHYTEVRPALKFLYIAYNRAIKLDAEKR